MKNYKVLFLLCFFQLLVFYQGKLLAQCENRCLDFDGIDDFISLNPSPITGNSDFTVELWFRSTATGGSGNCNTDFRRLFAFYNTPLTSRFEIGECTGLLSFFWRNGPTNGPFTMSTTSIRDGNWHHLAVVRTGSNIDVFLDCVFIYNYPSLGTLATTRMSVGNWSTTVNLNSSWQGQIDEVRVWNQPKLLTDIMATKHCLLKGNEPGLAMYWQFDQGVAGGNNQLPPITQVMDATSGSHNGTLTGFSLLPGLVSNFICSETPLIYPNYQNLDVNIKDYFAIPLTPITELCTGDLAHFCLSLNGQPALQPNLMSPLNHAAATVVWQFKDNTVSNWTNLPVVPFSGFCFPVGPGVITASCTGNPDGFIDRDYRAVVNLVDPLLGPCTYTSKTKTLRVCCPIEPATSISVVTNFAGNLLCENDAVNFTATLNSPDAFVNNLGPAVTIDWSFNGAVDASAHNQLSFTKPLFTANPPEICIEAVIKNCGGKAKTIKYCIPVDLHPMVGEIIAVLPNPNLSLVSTTPLKYSICPGNDAAIKMVVPASFKNKTAVWQYYLPSVGIWQDLGTSNPVQNTNILPCTHPANSPYLWDGGDTYIIYRIEERPEHDPSGCEPEHSNELTICLKTEPSADVVIGAVQICKGQSTQLTVQNYDPSYQYTWFCNGLQVGMGQFYTADKTACYWAEISNGCQVIETPKHCLTVCEIIPVISCPLPPNECACEGQPITLSGCDSKDNCAGTLTYTWTWDNGTLVSVNGCELEHIPPTDGTNYTLTVTNSLTGCSVATTAFLKPCKNQ